MRFSDIEEYGFQLWKSAKERKGTPGAPLTILGKPGIGKSAATRGIASRIADHLARRVLDLVEHPDFSGSVEEFVLFYAADLSSFLPEDLGGLPRTVERSVGGHPMLVTDYAAASWLAPFCIPGAVGVLCLDDLPAAAPAVQVAARQMVLDRRIGQKRLSDGVLVVVTGNRREDKAGATTLPSHFRNVVQLLNLDTDGIAFEGWQQWYGSTGFAPVIPSFLTFRPGRWSMTPADADAKGSYATPRSWAKLGEVFGPAKGAGVLREVAAGLVGEGVAVEFLAYLTTRSQLVDPAKVLNDPKGSVPDPGTILSTPDKMSAMVTGLAEVAGAQASSKDKELRLTATVRFVRALGWVTQSNREFISTGFHTFFANGGNPSSLVKAVRLNEHDPLIVLCKSFLEKVFS